MLPSKHRETVDLSYCGVMVFPPMTTKHNLIVQILVTAHLMICKKRGVTHVVYNLDVVILFYILSLSFGKWLHVQRVTCKT
jgi:hypothetical protein